MKILGISAYYHDAAAALICNGEIIAAAQEERFTRIKNDAAFPVNAIRCCLDFAGLTMQDIDAVVFYEKPFLKFERLLETYYAYAPKGLVSFLKAMPVWVKEKVFLKKIIKKELKKIGALHKKELLLLFPEHHLSHAASAFYPSPFKEAAILTIDGVGEWATCTIGLGSGKDITVLKEMAFPNSIGLLYSAFTYYCGFKVNSGEYKLMGLAPYGNAQAAQCTHFTQLIKSSLIDLQEDGSLLLDPSYFNYSTGLTMTNDRAWEALFGFARRKPESPIEQQHCNMALAIQQVIEEIIIKLAREAKRLTGLNNLCMAGGVALNCVANGKLDKEAIFENIFIQPAAGDAGAALGAAYSAHYIYFGNSRICDGIRDSLKGSFLGPAFTNEAILEVLQKYKAAYYTCTDIDDLCSRTAALIADGKIIGWFQGRMEFGPRALGARSILADPRNPLIQQKINMEVKFREDFRPFAPAVPSALLRDYFELAHDSPYMVFVAQLNENRKLTLPENYENLPVSAKLSIPRSDMPAITHVDYSARIQTVHQETNPPFWKLLEAFKKITGYAVLLNTSFNVRGEPIVNSPQDAYHCFLETAMDCLVIGNYMLEKKTPQNQQGKWKEHAV